MTKRERESITTLRRLLDAYERQPRLTLAAQAAQIIDELRSCELAKIQRAVAA